MWYRMKMAYCYTVWFPGKIIAFKPSESPLLCIERREGYQTSSVGTSWSTTSIKWISYCLLTHRVTIVHGGFTVYHISKWTGYEVRLNLLPFPIPAEAIMAHLSSCTGSDMSSNCLAFGVLGVIVSYEIKSHVYWQYGQKHCQLGFYGSWKNTGTLQSAVVNEWPHLSFIRVTVNNNFNQLTCVNCSLFRRH